MNSITQNMNILIVEDEHLQREMLSEVLKKEGYKTFEAGNGNDALSLINKTSIDLAIVDYKMPGQNGLEVLKEIKKISPETEVIMITAYGTIETAVNVMKAGAIDYITKPIDLEEVLFLIKRESEHRAVVRENNALRQQLQEKGITQKEIISKSRKMEKLINLAGRVAKSKASVLIQGESGTGKELLARLIHTLSPRSDKSLITVNCSALPESIIESELFGHEKGAYTGAHKQRIGRFEQADNGTLFLDEIGELPGTIQVKLLRFLQEEEFQRVGGDRTLTSDVRIVCATNKDLNDEVQKGNFRKDLFFRINVVTMEIPPLRERKEDIQDLVDHFLNRFSKRNSKAFHDISRDALNLLVKYDYPGNVRELKNILERAVVITRGSSINIEDLPFKEEDQMSFKELFKRKGTLKDILEDLEFRLVKEALDMTDGHQSKAAERLGISERMLRYKIKKYCLR